MNATHMGRCCWCVDSTTISSTWQFFFVCHGRNRALCIGWLFVLYVFYLINIEHRQWEYWVQLCSNEVVYSLLLTQLSKRDIVRIMNIVDKSNKVYNFHTRPAHAEHNCVQGVWRLCMDSVRRLFRLLLRNCHSRQTDKRKSKWFKTIQCLHSKWEDRKKKQKFSLLSDKNTLVSVQGSKIRMQIEKRGRKWFR